MLYSIDEVHIVLHIDVGTKFASRSRFQIFDVVHFKFIGQKPIIPYSNKLRKVDANRRDTFSFAKI